MRMRSIFICGLCGSTIFIFTLSHKRHDLPKKVIDHKMCILIFSTSLSEKFLILSRTERDVIINVHVSLFTVPAILV